MIGLKLDRGWAAAEEYFGKLPQKMGNATHQAVLKEAHYLRGKMVDGIDSGSPGGQRFAPHSPITIAVRKFVGQGGGSKIMIMSSTLRNNTKVIVLGKGIAFVGTNRKSKGGVNIAKIHDEGRNWKQPLSPRARRFLMAAMRAAGMQMAKKPKGAPPLGSVSIKIPPRPIVEPVIKRFARPADVRARFIKNLMAAMARGK